MKRLFVPILLLAAAPGLSGCIAAAVPIAAGIAMGTKSDKNDESRKNRAKAAEAAAAEADAAMMSGPTDGEAALDAARDDATIDGGLSDVRDEGEAGIPADAMGTATARAASEADATPSFADIPDPVGQVTEDERTFSTLFAKVTAIAQADPFTDEKRKSALLSDPGAMKPDRADCAFAQTAVLVDLDPGEDEAPLDERVVAPERLSRVLAALRAQEVAVLWLSRHTAVRAGAVRRALLRSGLDTLGNDELYLVRYEQETKATRRADAAADYCIVAILGDEKRDFDELYSYLKDPNAALPFDELFGDAWFVAPAPLTTTPLSEEG